MTARGRAPARRGGWGVPVALLALCAVPLIMGTVRLVTLAIGVEVLPGNARFLSSPVPLVLHIVGAGLFAILGAFQFADGFRRRHLRWHRVAGRLLVPCGLVVGLSGVWMTLFYPRAAGSGDLLAAFRLFFGSAMVVSIGLGVVAILRRDVPGHRAWMMRGYAIGLGAGTQVLTLAIGEMVAGPPDELSRALLNGAGWVINLAVAEWHIRGQAPERPTALRSPAGRDRSPSVASAISAGAQGR